MKHVVVYRTLNSKQLEFLRSNFKVSYFPDIKDARNNTSFLESMKTAVALYSAGLKVTKDLLNIAPNLKVISNFSAGFDNLDLSLLSDRKIIATNAPDALIDTVADLMFSLILTTSRRVVELDKFIRKGRWQENIGEELFGSDVHHKTLGILGLGRIGKKIAQRALGFDMDILYYKRTRDEAEEKKYQAVYTESLDELLCKSDIICITTPLTKETFHMINYEKFKLMKPHTIIVNGSRGSIIKESDLIAALKNKIIGGAGLDVYEQEPIDKTNELIKMDNVVLTPHIGSATKKTRQMMVEQGIDNLVAALNGERPKNQLNLFG